ncbi:MarR family winged helix-turn-helix transcriptional regulator [Massilia phyllosphaerae]|uniref:MarR family winged helix-turn-helix transcriptional regulator n=1 Tax=Massilia phyllosphaerae TaxID=3106034 RepID=UPI002B1CBCB8|nr:MarR family transcriptional regulator [Massilia sp. SGZ-792]
MSTDPNPAQLSEDLRSALKGLMRAMRRDAERQDSGLSLLQTMLLHSVGERPGIGVAELARMQQVRNPTMSAQVKALELAGLLARAAPDPQDRRRSGLQLTPEGQARLDQMHAQRMDWLSQRVARLSPEQLRQLAAAIEPLTLIAQP